MSLGSAYKAVTLFVKCNILCVFKNAPETTVRKYFQRCFGVVLRSYMKRRRRTDTNQYGLILIPASPTFCSLISMFTQHKRHLQCCIAEVLLLALEFRIFVAYQQAVFPEPSIC